MKGETTLKYEVKHIVTIFVIVAEFTQFYNLTWLENKTQLGIVSIPVCRGTTFYGLYLISMLDELKRMYYKE